MTGKQAHLINILFPCHPQPRPLQKFPPHLKQTTKAHIGLLFTNIFFGLNYSTVKYLTGHHYIGPFGINAVRVALTTALFWLVFLFKPAEPGIRREDIGRFVLCALTGVAINQLLFIKGLSMTWPIHASLLILITPILITIFAAIVLKESLGWRKVTGLALGISGALVLILNRQQNGQSSGGDVLIGDLFIIVNAVSYTIYFILVKPLMQHYPPLHVIRWVFTIGLFMVLPFGWTELSVVQWQHFDSTAFLSLFSIVFCGTFLAYLLNITGIKILGAGVAGSYIYSQPFFAAGIAVLFLHEPLELYKLLAAVLIFTGVYLANQSTNKNGVPDRP